MIKKLSFFIFMAGAVTFFCSMLPEKSFDTWWYVHGQPYYWYYQPDVFAFRCLDGKPWSESPDTSCVKFHFHRQLHHDEMNIIYFKPACSDDAKEAIKTSVRSSAWFEAEFPVITSYPHLSYASGAWFVVDDLLLVNFDADSLNEARFSRFKMDYALQQINYPDSISPAGDFTYIFQMEANELKSGSAIDLAKTIYLQDSGWINNVQPNLINAYEEVPDTIGVLGLGGDFVADNIGFYIVNHDNKSISLFVKQSEGATGMIVKVYDLFGRVVDSINATSGQIKKDIVISDYAGGIYFASIENESGKLLGVQRFVKL